VCLTVYKAGANGDVWDFDELVYFTASKLANSGSSAKNPLTIISLSQTRSLADGLTGFSQGGSGIGDGEKGEKRRSEIRQEIKGDPLLSRRQFPLKSTPRCKINNLPLTVNILITFHGGQSIFQTLTVHGSLSIEITFHRSQIVVLPNQNSPVDDAAGSVPTPVFTTSYSILT